MADSKLQREYTLTDALCDIAVGGAQDDTAKVERASEWVGRHVAELKQQVAALTEAGAARIQATEVRPGDCVVFTLRDAPLSHADYAHVHSAITQLVREKFGDDVQALVVDGADASVFRPTTDPGVISRATGLPRSFCPSVYTGPQGRLECDRPRGHGKFGHTATIRHADGEGAIGWDDTSQDGARCPVTAPKPCVLEIRHPGNHRSNSGTEWPSPMCDRGHIGCAKAHELLDVNGLCGHAHRWRSGVIYCDMERGHEGDHRAPGPLQERLVWDRDEPDAFEARSAADSEERCPIKKVNPMNGDTSPCVRERWHLLPHMDAVAIAQAGNAGEVWE